MTLNKDEALTEAKKFFVNKDYDQAIDVILKAKSTLDPGLFHYNIGSLYLKKNNLGPARFHLEKAREQGFTFPMLYKNLEFINSKAEIYDPSKAKSLEETVVAKFLDTPMNMFLILSLLLTSLSLLLFRFKYKGRGLVLGLLLVIALIPTVTKFSLERGLRVGVALQDLRVYEGPSKIYTDFGVISSGSRVILNQAHDGWSYVMSPKEIRGWVEIKEIGFY